MDGTSVTQRRDLRLQVARRQVPEILTWAGGLTLVFALVNYLTLPGEGPASWAINLLFGPLFIILAWLIHAERIPLAAVPVAWLAARGRLPRPALHVWNAVGFALLVNIMAVAILSFPTPFRQFWNEPANVFVTRLPYVWLPTFLVPVAWFGHVAVWANARRNQTRP